MTRILVVDDEPQLLRALGINLRASGYEVHAAATGAEALRLAQEAWAKFEPRNDGRIWVGAGLRLKNLCGLASKAGLTGFEFLEGIPGNVGGALRMNAGAMGGWMWGGADV